MRVEAEHYENLNTVEKRQGNVPFYYQAAKVLRGGPVEPRWHEEIEIKYILCGTAEIICGTEVFLATKGDVVVINSCEPHGVRRYGDESLSYHLLMVAPSLPLLRDAGIHEQSTFRNLIRADAALNAVMEHLFSELTRQDTAWELGARGALSLLFVRLLRYHGISRPVLPPEHRRMAERIQPAIDHILRHYPEEIGVPALAQLCAMSVYHFCRVFKTVTGSTVVSYVNRLRTGKAAALLQASDLSVQEIAAAVGWEDACYFSRCFKKWFDISPSDYRKLHGKTAK